MSLRIFPGALSKWNNRVTIQSRLGKGEHWELLPHPLAGGVVVPLEMGTALRGPVKAL